MQIVKTGLCSVLLRVFDRWDRYEGRMRLKICAHILQTLQHLCNISMLYTFFYICFAQQFFDSTIKVSFIHVHNITLTDYPYINRSVPISLLRVNRFSFCLIAFDEF